MHNLAHLNISILIEALYGSTNRFRLGLNIDAAFLLTKWSDAFLY